MGHQTLNPSQRAGVDLILWLAASSLGLADGTAVASWTDLSGLGNHAVQATGANQPIFKTAIINGQPVVRFNGTNSWMAVPQLTKGAFTAFYVYKASAGMLWESGPSGSWGNYHYTQGGAHFSNNGIGGASAFDASGVTFTDSTWRVVTQVGDGSEANHRAYVNGVLRTRGTIYNAAEPTDTPTTKLIYIGSRGGASLWYNGDIAEIIIYNRALLNEERHAREFVLGAKYGITIT